MGALPGGIGVQLPGRLRVYGDAKKTRPGCGTLVSVSPTRFRLLMHSRVRVLVRSFMAHAAPAPAWLVPASLSIADAVELHQAGRVVRMPRFGLGVYQCRNDGEAYRAVLAALRMGYRHIDTAAVYGNEKDVGRAVRDSGIPREEIFVTTKVWNTDHGYAKCLAACQASLDRLGMSYVDLYLVHSPVPRLRLETWRAMEHLLEEGRCRAIGVSNYGVHHLQELLAVCKHRPVVNQLELSPYLNRAELVQFCWDNNIVAEAYSPLTKGRRLGDPRLVALASKYRKTPAQILIRWSLQRGFICIPKSSSEARIRENADVFDFALSADDVATMCSWEEGLVTGWDPTVSP